MKLHSLHAGYFTLDGGAMFGVVPKSIWNKLNPADENNLCTWSLRLLLVETADRLVLIDSGMGNKQDEKFMGHYHLSQTQSLEALLAQKGFAPQDLTDLFHTHLHFDHCGGSIVREAGELLPAFPQARYWSNAVHWEWATVPNAREKASFLPENILPMQSAGNLQFVPIPSSPFDANGLLSQSPFLPGFDVRFAHGHTAAMMLPQIQYKGRTLVFMADLLPSAAHVPLPYVMGYDMFPLTTLEEKKSFFSEAVKNEYVFFLEHDPKWDCCTLQETEKGIRVKETFQLADL